MRILLDECVNPRVKDAFPKHEVQTVKEMGWGGISNGKLIALAQQSFDVFLTVDQNLEHQQNLAKLTLGLVVISVPDNNINYFKPLFPELLKAAETVRPGQVIHIDSPVRTDKLLRLITAPSSIPLGHSAIVEVEVSNPEEHPASITVAGHPPFGAGLSFDSPQPQTLHLGPGHTARIQFAIRADRPHEVNLGKPWELKISSAAETISVPIQISDPNPGRTFYLLTEDCETFDGGPLTGDYVRYGIAHFGNQNNFMDPEDYRVQMIHKPNRINQIAERHGAKWTHFYAATQRFGAEWAAKQSTTGEWPKILEEMDESIRAGAKLHEYSPHIHFDYEPDSALPPQPRLIYDPATDGIIPNDYYHPETNPTHRHHDWDGSARGNSYIKALGDWTELDTKAGSMRKSLLHLARLQANRRTPLVSRTGSHDFGKDPQDQAISTQAYLDNGLRGNSDAYRPGAPPTPGGQMFWCTEHDRQQPVTGIHQAQLVQFAITMDSLFPSADEVNQWFANHWPSTQGPGVHALLFTTHAMFFRGEPDPFRSLEGGAFDQLDRHLAWVRENYPGVKFATATEALLEYLDYYTPSLQAIAEPPSGLYEFPIRLLGRGIRVGESHPATVTIAAPPCFSPSELLEMRIHQNGRVIAVQTSFDDRRQPVITLTLTSRAPLRLEILPRTKAVNTKGHMKTSGFNQFDPEYDLKCETPSQIDYIICTGQRSGGHYLGHLMYSTGAMGYPLEYFNPDHFARWKALSACSETSGVVDYIRSRRTSPNGCFGIKADFEQFTFAVCDCGFNALFPRCRFILIERRDLLGQAISLVRARQTNQWISLHERTGTAKYDRQAIEQAMAYSLEENASWRRYFAALGQEFMEVTYESLVENPVAVVGRIAEYLGVAPVQIRFDLVLPQKQADGESEQWRQQFQREASASGPAYACRRKTIEVS